jgi:hypothetical protein
LKKFAIALLFGIPAFVVSQKPEEKGQFSGNLLLNYQKYLRDDRIGANTKVYLENSASVDAWLFMNYRIKGYSLTMRFDAFNNSPLLNPQGSFTQHGIGYWQASKQIDDLNITVGSFYDQFGSGILFRAYEQRQIGIDYAIQGVRLQYDFGKNWRLKGFGGNQKGALDNRFGYANQVISGLNLEGSFDLGKDARFGSMEVGGSAINRTLDRSTVDALVSEINTYDISKRFLPKYNVYGFNAYYTYHLGNLTWNTELNYKTPEAMRNLQNRLFLSDGKVLYTSLSWGKSGIRLGKQKASIGVNVQARHVDKFAFRSSPNDILLQGLVSYLPSLTRQNTYRLLARYNAPAQDLGEQGIQGEIDFKPRKGTQILLNGSFVRSLNHNGINNEKILLFRELYGEVIQAIGKKTKLKLGLQSIIYNQARYEFEPEYATVRTFTPFGEVTLKLPKHRSLRIEAQYLKTAQDQGSFANLVAELYLSPVWYVGAGDMVNIEPHRYKNMVIVNEVLHYPSVYMGYTKGNSVYTFGYLKQQQGVNCSGGICRLEPAFSGVRFTVSTNF